MKNPRDIIMRGICCPNGECQSGGGACLRGECRDDANDAIAALSAAGFVIVPREPTNEMLSMLPRLYESHGERADIEDIWRRMIMAWEKPDG